MKFVKLFDFIDLSVPWSIAYFLELIIVKRSNLENKCLFQFLFEREGTPVNSSVFMVGISFFDYHDAFRIYFSSRKYTIRFGIFSNSKHDIKWGSLETVHQP